MIYFVVSVQIDKEKGIVFNQKRIKKLRIREERGLMPRR